MSLSVLVTAHPFPLEALGASPHGSPTWADRSRVNKNSGQSFQLYLPAAHMQRDIGDISPLPKILNTGSLLLLLLGVAPKPLTSLALAHAGSVPFLSTSTGSTMPGKWDIATNLSDRDFYLVIYFGENPVPLFPELSFLWTHLVNHRSSANQRTNNMKKTLFGKHLRGKVQVYAGIHMWGCVCTCTRICVEARGQT